MTRILAAADIGSNTAHLLIAATNGDSLVRVDNTNEWIPLGEVVSTKGYIPPDVTQQLISAVKEFRRLSKDKSAEQLYVFATEGMRVAENHDAVLGAIKSEAGVSVEIISPAREAELSFRGIQLDCRDYPTDLMFEVGGGSAQIARVSDGHLVSSESLRLGTGRIIASAGLRSPATDDMMAAAQTTIEQSLDTLRLSGTFSNAVLSGGVGRGLWRALHPDGDKVLHREEIAYLLWSSQRLTVEQISTRFRVKPKRAGTLLPGALVYLALMDRFGLTHIRVSEYGIREGAILQMFEQGSLAL